MKHTFPRGELEKNKIIDWLAETFPNRRAWINEKGPSISEIVELYPRLLDFDGSMVYQNFY